MVGFARLSIGSADREGPHFEAPVTRHNLTKPDLPIAAPASPGAVRMRRHRWLKQQGAVAVDLVVGADAIRALVANGWLDPADRGDRDAVGAAITALAAHALRLDNSGAGA